VNDSETLAFILRVFRIFDWSNGLSCEELWWRTDGEFAPVRFFVTCNDLFWWGTGDAEDITPENVAALEQAVADCRAAHPNGRGSRGPELFCARIRGERPQGAAYPKEKELWPLFDACGPAREVGLGNPHLHPRDRPTEAT